MACAIARTGASLTQGFFSRERNSGAALLRRTTAGVGCAIRIGAGPPQPAAWSVPVWAGATGVPLRADLWHRALQNPRFILRADRRPPGGGGLKLWRDASPDRSARHAHLYVKFGKLFFVTHSASREPYERRGENVNQFNGAIFSICREIRVGGGG